MLRALCLMIAAAVLSTPATADPAFGRWLVENGKAVIEIEPCGELACGRLVWLRNPFDTEGRPKRDEKNPDVAQRSRLLCRLPLIMGLTRSSPGVWEDGEIYSTRDGRSFSFKIEDVADDRLTVRGYVGLSLLGRSQVWTRDDGMRGSCVASSAPGAVDR